ncbi:luciferase family protein [Streptomyces sp. NPDC004732]|uniref:luciferase domain-containing protein n=1 Tax=Streptomyces sp. NPDC004732 TaxID=3154290 RepID=UPI0033BBC91E
MTLALRAMTRLASWPDLSETLPSCATGRALCSARGEIAHFHSDRDVDLHLTAGAIRRLGDQLKVCAAVRLVPGSSWVSIRLEADTDIELLMTLVSMALLAHHAWPVPLDEMSAGCNEQRGAVFPRENAYGG